MLILWKWFNLIWNVIWILDGNVFNILFVGKLILCNKILIVFFVYIFMGKVKLIVLGINLVFFILVSVICCFNVFIIFLKLIFCV